jgi:hypothetical protein
VCGNDFECRPGQGCWCEALPNVVPVPKAGGQCLCPCQLGPKLAVHKKTR